ncbi:HupE/UreJ family protein [Xanthobacter sp. KR7-65]|uniref:HupE/UreJ family protein n=1 Tax=Xanthobacter sp. KR7-65 TaxID=3156612 RepID=UPI0032B310E8
MRRAARLLALAAALALTPGVAEAHLVDTRLGDFYSGALHPLTDLQQVLPWIALAVLAAFQGAARARWVVLAFPLALLAGAMAEMVLQLPTEAPILGLVLVAAMGLAVAAAARLPLPALIALAVVAGLLHGAQNAATMGPATDRLLFISGMIASGYAVVTLGIGAAIAFLRGGTWRPIALRAGGSWVAAVGIMVLGLQMMTRAAAG